MDFNYEETPEYLRLKAYEDAQVERYLTERTPEEMRMDLWHQVCANERLMAGLSEQLSTLRLENRALMQQMEDLSGQTTDI